MPRSNLTLSILAGICLGTAFLHPFLSPLAIVGLVLFIRAVTSSLYVKEAILAGLIVGVLKYAGAIACIWATYPLSWLGIAPIFTQLLLIGGVWFLNMFLLGTSLAVVAGIFYWLYRRHKNYLYLFPIFLVAGEMLGSIIFSLHSLGPGSNINIDFSFGYLGYPLAYLPGFLPLGVFGGVYALSFFIGCLALLIYLIWFQDPRLKTKTTRVLIIALIVWLSAANIYLYQRSSPNLGSNIVAISTRFDAELLSHDVGYAVKETKIKEATKAALGLNPDIILLPEDSRFISSFATKEEIFDFLHQNSIESEVLVVDSSRTPINETEVTLRAYFFDLKNNEVYAIDKQHFVPQGEYLPYLSTFWMNLVGQDEFIKKVTHDRSYRPGPASSYDNMPTSIPSVLFCFESIIPSGVAEVWRPQSPDLILHPVSQAWFHDSKILRYQLDRMLRVQAIANNTNIVQAGNMAPSLIYKPDGQIDFGLLLHKDEYYSLHGFGSF